MILDHVNGIRNDNRIENIRFVCPNCNSTLDTHCGKQNAGKHSCGICGKMCSKRRVFCSRACFGKGSEADKTWLRKVERPSKDDLEKLIWEKPTTEIAAALGVSDKAVAKWCQRYGIKKPGRGYWAKKYGGHGVVALHAAL